MSDDDEAKVAIDNLNGYEIKGRKMKVQQSSFLNEEFDSPYRFDSPTVDWTGVIT